MNSGLAVWYLTSALYSGFEELFDKVFTNEELSCNTSAVKAPQFAIVNVVANAYVTNDHNNHEREWRNKQNHEKENHHASSPHDEVLSKKWPDPY